MDQHDILRAEARRIFLAGVAAASPEKAVAEALEARALDHPAPVVIAVGKAAVGMAKAAMERVTPRAVIIVTNPENAQEVAGAEVFAAAHPVPDAIGEAAGARVAACLSSLGEADAVLALISGGGSALLPAPLAGVSLEDKAGLNSALLASGAEITEMNLVRQQLSRLKGGGFLRLAAPASVRALILSDVVGDDMRVIASGPTAEPIGTRADARAVLERYGLWERVSPAVQTALSQPEDTTPLPPVDATLIGSNSLSRRAMARAAPNGQLMPADLDGDVEIAAQRVAAFATGPGTYLMGGETTVRLTGTGRGGRNQELAIHLAREAERQGWSGPWVYLQGGTDGRDGPTDAAGAVVDDGTLSRMEEAGCALDEMLGNNDSYALLKASGDLLMTGGTGTNVADLGVLIRT